MCQGKPVAQVEALYKLGDSIQEQFLNCQHFNYQYSYSQIVVRKSCVIHEVLVLTDESLMIMYMLMPSVLIIHRVLGFLQFLL